MKRTPEIFVCRECRTVHEDNSHIERHWFDAFAVFAERVSDDCNVCGGVIEEGYTCDMCYGPTPESDTAFENGRAYCRDCKRECMYCFEVKPADEFTPSGERDYEWCAECAKAYAESEVA